MQILLDTHVVLWALTDDAALKGEARAMLSDTRNGIWVSAVSIWEISIKHSLGRGDMPLSGKDALTYCRKSGYRWLDIRPEHAVAVEDLPAIHADPFDRLLVAQALTEPMKLLTHDVVIARYHPDILLI
jgi:PIN domain nuclease of toxin-antitoxin system